MGAPGIADADLYELAQRTGQALRAAGWRIATAESCTAGWIAKALTDVPGSSRWFECGYVTYSNAAKMRDVGVCAQTLTAYGAVSEATVREMAQGALTSSGAELAVAVSGIAGPDGGTAEKPVGTVWFAVAARGRREAQCVVRRFSGDREAVRRQSVAHALRLVLSSLGDLPDEGSGALHRRGPGA
jgi:nicotinamide-nucleotide amidase